MEMSIFNAPTVHTCTFREECEAIGELAGIDGTDIFCHRQCMVYPSDNTNCPTDKCRCTTSNQVVNSNPAIEEGDVNSVIES